MILFPAIDLIGGQAVRLYQGDYAQKTVYSADPVSVARDFRDQGATHIHLVDLDGAKAGTPQNFDLICRIKRQTGLFVEVGGGIRTQSTIERYLSEGIDRVILGTAAVTDPDLILSLPDAIKEKIAVGVDAAGGKIAIRGWTEASGYELFSFCEDLQSKGVGTVICTDISKDGAMRGANHELYRALSERVGMQIVASGGVSGIDDLVRLKALGLYGAIIGKAYYEGALNLKEALEVAR